MRNPSRISQTITTMASTLTLSPLLIIENNADINAESGEYENALQAASVRGHEKTVQLLLNKNIDVNARVDTSEVLCRRHRHTATRRSSIPTTTFAIRDLPIFVGSRDLSSAFNK